MRIGRHSYSITSHPLPSPLPEVSARFHMKTEGSVTESKSSETCHSDSKLGQISRVRSHVKTYQSGTPQEKSQSYNMFGKLENVKGFSNWSQAEQEKCSAAEAIPNSC